MKRRSHFSEAKPNEGTVQRVDVCSKACADDFDALPLHKQMTVGHFYDEAEDNHGIVVEEIEVDSLEEFLAAWKSLAEKARS